MTYSVISFSSLALLFFYIAHVNGANILAIFPMVQKSHYGMYKKLVEQLAEKGHNVDVVGGIPEATSKNISGLNFIDFPKTNHLNLKKPFTINDLRGFTVKFSVDFMFSIDGGPLCEKSLSTDVMKSLRNSKKKYDLLLIEIFICDCFYGFAHIFKTPVISLISSSDLPWGGYRIGNPDNPAYIPVYFQPYKPHESLKDRLLNVISYVQTKFGHWWYIQQQNELSKNFFGQDMPHLNDIVGNSSLILINSHFSINVARPTVPNFIEVGGLHIGTPKPLDRKIGDFIGDSKLIYFSLGSIANSETLEPNILNNIMQAFSEIKYKIIWKSNATKIRDMVKIPSNVLVQSWMPQLDILCHPNAVLFITHAGLMGTQEAIHCGVPLLCMPLFADQYQNCQSMVDKGVAETLNVETITKDEFKSTLLELIQIPRYIKKAKILSLQFKDRPLSPLETAMFWTEYVIRHKGAPQLKSLAQSLKWYQYHLIDVICILFLFLLLVLLMSYVILKYILARMNKLKGRKINAKKNS